MRAVERDARADYVATSAAKQRWGASMDDRKWEKLAAFGGVAFVALNVVASVIQGAPPAAGDTNDEVLKWYSDNKSGIKVAAFLSALSIIVLVWWFGSLWRRMSRVENGNHRLSVVSLIGLAGSGALFAASTSVLATTAIEVDNVNADAAKLFTVLSTVLLAMAGAFVVAHIGAASALALRSRFLPRWVAVLGLVSAALFLVATSAAGSYSDGAMFAGFLGFITWMVWILAVSAHLWRTADSTA
jgi:hypothetical protein